MILSDSCLKVMKKLIQRCWHPNPESRPEFEEIVKTLDAEIKKLPRTAFRRGGGQEGACCSMQ